MREQIIHCKNCFSDRVERGDLIVERERQTISGGGYAGGEYVRTYGTSETPRVRRLTADEPRKATRWTTLFAFTLCGVILLSGCGGCFIYSASSAYSAASDKITGSDIVILLATIWGMVLMIGVIGGILIRMRRRRVYRRWYQDVLSRRYYCNNCGAIFQN